MTSISESYELIKSQIRTAEEKSGRVAGSVELIAVSKTWPAQVVSELVECGHRDFGENRVQELELKHPDLPSSLRWHFIGHLQKNKVRKVLPFTEKIHSVDSLDIAKRINSIAHELGLFPKIYIQVNHAKESTKFGFSAEELSSSFDSLMQLDRIEIEGLMVIPPFDSDPENVRPEFAALRKLRDELEQKHDIKLPGLSMGMSNDFHVAIEEGSTSVRIGSSIFGKRKVIKPNQNE
ncbi:MAG: YggS family pyridoxal phosphate-dependent enzyme [Verrucomicrobiota bacterium]|nr:YggS family pyridoxal phosphate-dependent enzyme [Verrucomicrobiota bacterium]